MNNRKIRVNRKPAKVGTNPLIDGLVSDNSALSKLCAVLEDRLAVSGKKTAAYIMELRGLRNNRKEDIQRLNHATSKIGAMNKKIQTLTSELRHARKVNHVERNKTVDKSYTSSTYKSGHASRIQRMQDYAAGRSKK